MAKTTRKKKDKPRGRRGVLLKVFGGTALLSVGAAAGVVLGAVTETPRLLVSWLSDPVVQIDLSPVPVDVNDTTLEEFRKRRTAVVESGAAQSRTIAAKPSASPDSAELAESKPAKDLNKPEAPVVRPPVVPPAPSAVRPASARPRVASPPPDQVSSRSTSSETVSPRSPEQIMAELGKRSRAKSSSKVGRRAHSRHLVVQIGAHGRSSYAEEQARSLRGFGFDAYVSNTRSQDSKSRYRVRVRPKVAETAQELRSQLQARGFDTWTTTE
ncbi:MAG: SPOR domain-containing protein [bacterium]|nr:SPOR domain-containing protein [bacterium]